MTIKKEILDKLLKNYSNPEDLLGEPGIIKQLTKALLERALDGEMTHHLGYHKHAKTGRNTGNSRNGKNTIKCFLGRSQKTSVDIDLF